MNDHADETRPAAAAARDNGGGDRRATYAAAGVNIEAGEQAVELLKSTVPQTFRPEVVGGLGGFAGLFALDLTKYRKPLLAASTDGVGTKIVIAQQLGVHDTIGVDLVAMVVDDIVACGAEPLFLLDYIACGEVVPERVNEIAAGITNGCRQAGCSLLGGEIAEHPGVIRPGEYDVSATGVGVVEADEALDERRVQVGDVLIAMGSSGLHSNGYSLVRHVLLGAGRMRVDTVVEEFGGQRTLGEELLTPTRIYARDCLALIEACDVHAFAHITGGGIPGNVARILPEGAAAVVDRATWRPQPVFDLIAERGRVQREEMERTFNMGAGMVAAVAAADADRALELLRSRDVPAWVVGTVATGDRQVRMVNDYAS